MVEVTVCRGANTCHDAFGFGIHYRNPDPVTSAGVTEIHKELVARYPAPVRYPDPDPGFDYTPYVFTPWHLWDARKTPEAVSDRLRMRSPNTVAADALDSYCGSGLPYFHCWDTAFVPVPERIALMAKYVANPVGVRSLVVGSAGSQLLFSLASLGMDPYGIEVDQKLAAQTHPLLRDRVVVGDVLCHMYRFGSDSMPVVLMTCVGYLQWPDVRRCLREIWRVQPWYGLLFLYAVPDTQEIDDVAKARFGTYIKQARTYHKAIADSGYRVKAQSNGTVVAYKANTPSYTEDWA